MAELFLKIAFGCYALAAALCVLPAGILSKSREDTSVFLIRAGFVFHSAMVALRWLAAGRPPFANMYEALVLFAWAIVLVGIVFGMLHRTRLLIQPVLFLAIIILASIFYQDSAIKPLMPALQSRWMAVHVVTYFIGYAALSLAFVLSLMYLARAGRREPGQDVAILDRFSYQLILLGFPFLTIGMTTGSIWANVAWGTYWNWDPKETCSLITWLVYIVYLHLRSLRGWKERKAAWVSILGFLATLFTFIGVNYVLRGLHSYAQ